MKRRRRILLSLAHAAIAIELALVLGFGTALLSGERTRAGFVALYLPRQPVLALALAATFVALLVRRRSLFVVQGAVCLVVLLPVMGMRFGGVLGKPVVDRPLRLATYNVFFGKLGRGEVLAEIESAARDADVVLLQATWDSMADRLRERLTDRVVHRSGELVLVSRFPILDVDVPPDVEGVPAMYIGYLLDTPRGPLRVYNVHPYSPRHALRAGERVDANLAQREAQIAGDTNLPELSSIARRHFVGLCDAWREVGFGFGYTFPAKLPWMRIDRVLGGTGIRFVDIGVAPRGASDHRALFVDLDVIPSPTAEASCTGD